MPTPSDASPPWPFQADASWPRGCLVENVAMHPSEPWIAVACTNAKAELGAVLVFDAQTGAIRSTTPIDNYVGWSDPHLLRWHPDGVRLGTNLSTNGIALLDHAAYVGAVFPDETRDGGVEYVWVGDQMFTSTGSLFEIQEGDWRFDLEMQAGVEELGLQAIEWNATQTFVVGRVDLGIVAYDPIARRMVYAQPLDGDLPSKNKPKTTPASPTVSPDGRWVARQHYTVSPNPDEILFVNGDTGEIHGLRTASSPRIARMIWALDGSLAVSCHVHNIGGPPTQRHLDLFVAGERKTVIDLGARVIEGSYSVPEAGPIAWSPTADGVALLLANQQVQVLDATTGKALSSFHAPAPAIPPGLPDWYTGGHRPDFGFPGDLMWVHQQRLIRIAPHFVSMWSMDGTKIAEFVVPD